MVGTPLEVALGHVGEGLSCGLEVAAVHLQTMVETVAREVAENIGLATHVAAQVSMTVLCNIQNSKSSSVHDCSHCNKIICQM